MNEKYMYFQHLKDYLPDKEIELKNIIQMFLNTLVSVEDGIAS
jgi:hypothetical protein